MSDVTRILSQIEPREPWRLLGQRSRALRVVEPGQGLPGEPPRVQRLPRCPESVRNPPVGGGRQVGERNELESAERR